MKIRIIFVLIMAASISFLLYLNYSPIDIQTNYSHKIMVIIFIFAVTCIFAAYLVYESYRIMYSEMIERMNMIAASKNDLQTTYDSLSMFMVEIESDHTVVNINHAGCEYLKCKKRHILGKSFSLVFPFHADVQEELQQLIDDTFEKGETKTMEVDNRGRSFEVFTFPLQDSSDRMKKILVMLNDVTEARAAYRQLLQENKMVAIGQLAAGVAHEIRNPLGLIRNYCHLLKKSDPDDIEMRAKAIAMIEHAVDRSNDIINNLLQFSKVSKQSWKMVNLKQTILAIISLEEHLFADHRVRVELHCAEDIELYTLLESLEIIFINLLINAMDAMDEGGEITITCTEQGDSVMISVVDQGIGIQEDIKGSIFNPFFTTKESRNGAGLGLYLVYSELGKLGGTIDVKSQTGEGAEFIITLPVERGRLQ